MRGPMRHAKQHEIVVALCLPAGALLVSLLVFGVFVACSGANPFAAYALMYQGGFGTWFSWQNTLQRAAPLPDGSVYGHPGTVGPGHHWRWGRSGVGWAGRRGHGSP